MSSVAPPPTAPCAADGPLISDAAVSRSAACLATGERLLALPRQLSSMLCDYVEGQTDRTARVVQLASPAEITAAFAESGTPVSLGRGCGAPRAEGGAADAGDEAQAPVDEAALIKSVEHVLEYSVRTSHPHFLSEFVYTHNFTSKTNLFKRHHLS